LKTLSIIIPVYNEENTVADILSRVLSVDLINGINKEVLVVDDCSTDGTRVAIDAFLKTYSSDQVRILSHEVNRGKGAALHTGIREATGDYVVVQDADREYDPEEFNILLSPVVRGEADVVYGSRFMGGNPHRVLFFWHSIGNKLLTFFSNMFTNLNLTDMETCYKLFRREVIQQVQLKEKRFGFEPEVTAKISRIPGIRIYEVGISYYGRTYAEGKKIGWKDGFRALYCVVKYNIFSK
jgi:glycosyltransferase involved in cell wall biosynthesis